MLGSFHITDDIEAGGVGERLRRKHEMHADDALRGKRGDEVRILRGDCAGGNLRQVFFLIGGARVREPIFSASHRTDERRKGPETTRPRWTRSGKRRGGKEGR